MCALNVYTHYDLRILNFWKAFQRLPLHKELSRPMSLDLKRQLVAQLVESSRLLRNYIDHRAKGRGTTRAQWIVLFRLRQQEGLSQVDLADVLELQPISHRRRCRTSRKCRAHHNRPSHLPSHFRCQESRLARSERGLAFAFFQMASRCSAVVTEANLVHITAHDRRAWLRNPQRQFWSA